MAELCREKLSLKTKYDLLSTEKTERDLVFARARFYEHGEKAGRLLAQQLKSKSAARLIPKIRKTSQEITVDPQEMYSIFHKYYSYLYSSEFPHDKPLQLQEIEDSIKAMQSGKAPGPDGFPVKFYKNVPHNCPIYFLICSITHLTNQNCHQVLHRPILQFFWSQIKMPLTVLRTDLFPY